MLAEGVKPSSKLLLYCLAARPKTLTAAVVPVMVGTACAFLSSSNEERGAFKWWIAAIALLCAVLIQVGTNLFNDALDSKTGADGPTRLGPTRVTSAGLLSYRTVLLTGTVSFVIALALGAILVLHSGLPILIIGLLSLLFGYLYTGGPFPLAYNGLGEIFVFIFFGLVAVSGTTFLYTNAIEPSALLAGAQVGLLAVTIISINNFRDIESDRCANKRTLPVLLGQQRARSQIIASILIPYLLGAFWLSSAPAAFLLPLLTAPLGAVLILKTLKIEPSRECNKLLGLAAMLHLTFGLLLLSGIAVAT